MKKIKDLFVLTILLIATSCNQSQSSIDVIQINNKQAKTSSLSEHFEVVKSVCLDTKNRSYISSIDKILKTPNHYILLNKFDQNSLFVFDHDGMLLKELKSSNFEQYNVHQFYDILYSSQSNEIELLTDTGIVYLATDNFSYIKKQSLDFSATKFSKSKDFYHFITPSESGLTIIDSSFDSSNKMTYFPENNSMPFYQMAGINSFTSFNNTTRYFRNFDNTIYSIKKDKLAPKWTFDFNETSFSEKDKEQINNPNEVYEIENKSFLHKFYFETENLIYLSFFKNDNFTVCLVNKKSKNKTCFNVIDSDNDITNESYFPFIMNTTKGGNFLALKNLEPEESDNCDSDFSIYELKFTN